VAELFASASSKPTSTTLLSTSKKGYPAPEASAAAFSPAAALASAFARAGSSQKPCKPEGPPPDAIRSSIMHVSGRAVVPGEVDAVSDGASPPVPETPYRSCPRRTFYSAPAVIVPTDSGVDLEEKPQDHRLTYPTCPSMPRTNRPRQPVGYSRVLPVQVLDDDTSAGTSQGCAAPIQ